MTVRPVHTPISPTSRPSAAGNPLASGRAAIRRLLLLVGACALALPLALLGAGPAAAHDALISSDPAEGTSLEEIPSELTFTYSASIQELGAEVELSDGQGDAVALGDHQVDGAVLTVPVEGTPEGGDYSAAWRVVSSDGHPISGTLTFSVAEGAGEDGANETSGTETGGTETGGTETTAPTSGSETTSPEATPTGSSPDDVVTATPTAETESGDGRSPWPLIGGLAIVIAAAGIAFYLLRRRG